MSQAIPARPEHSAALHKLEARTFPEDPWTEQQLASHLRRPDAIALVLPKPEGSRLLGAATGWAIGGVAELLRISVDPKARGAGLGRGLLRAFLDRCLERGAEEVWLEVRADNHHAIRLYLAEGFVQTGFRASYYTDGQSAVLMTWRPGQPAAEEPGPVEPEAPAEDPALLLAELLLKA